MGHSSYDPVDTGPARNAGRKLRAKRALKPRNMGHPIHARPRQEGLGSCLFDLAIDSKLRGCDLVKVRIAD